MKLLFLLNTRPRPPLTGPRVGAENTHALRLVVQSGKHGRLSLTAPAQHVFLGPAGYVLGSRLRVLARPTCVGSETTAPPRCSSAQKRAA